MLDNAQGGVYEQGTLRLFIMTKQPYLSQM